MRARHEEIEGAPVWSRVRRFYPPAARQAGDAATRPMTLRAADVFVGDEIHTRHAARDAGRSSAIRR